MRRANVQASRDLAARYVKACDEILAIAGQEGARPHAEAAVTAPIGQPDVEAFTVDVLGGMAEEVDGASFPRLLELEAAVQQVVKACGDTLALIRSELLRQAAEPIRVGNVVYSAVEDGKWRYDHRAVKKLAHKQATITALANDGVDAVALALDLFAACYVSSSSRATDKGLAILEASRRDVASWEHTGFRLDRHELPEVPE